jgi:zinc protease
MIRRVLAAAVVTALTLVGGRAPAKPAADDDAGVSLDVTRFELDNGLQVILHEDHASPTVAVLVWYHVGSKDERPGRSGFAHLFEHLMFKGSRHVPDGQFDILLEGAGGRNNGTTNADRTDFFEQVPSNFLELALYLESDRMAGLWDAMNQTVLDNQRDVVKNERRQSYENQPYGQANLEIQQSLWPEGHGNHNLTIGKMADLTAATLGDVEHFYRTYYVPSNATLVITGDIDEKATRALVDRYFGWMARKPEPPHVTLEGKVTPRAETATLETEDQVTVPKVMVTWRSPTPYAPGDADLDLAARILAGGKTSRLYRRLVMRERLASSVYAYQYPQMLGGEFQIGAMVKDGVDPDEVLAAIDDEVAKLSSAGPTGDELVRAVNLHEAEFLSGLESLIARADLLAGYAAYVGKVDYLATDLARYRAATPASVRDAARAWLVPDGRVVMTVVPEKPKASAKADDEAPHEETDR